MQLNPQKRQEGHDGVRRYVAKLERRSPLDAEDRAVLLALPAVDRAYIGGQTIAAQNIVATHCAFIAKGLVSRVVNVGGESRQIVALHVPGDAVDLQSILFTRIDHAIRAHGDTDVSWIAHADLLDAAACRPSLARLLWLDTLVEASIFRTWTANIGRRNAQQRTAHLLLEMLARLEAVGEGNDGSYELPLTQSAMADALGLSLVHMNKSLQALRRAGHVEIRARTVEIRDRERLVAFAGFDDGYLHLEGGRIKDLNHRRSHRHGRHSDPHESTEVLPFFRFPVAQATSHKEPP